MNLFNLIHLTLGFCLLHSFRFRKGNMRLLCVSIRWVNGLNKISWRPTDQHCSVCVCVCVRFGSILDTAWKPQRYSHPEWLLDARTHPRTHTRGYPNCLTIYRPALSGCLSKLKIALLHAFTLCVFFPLTDKTTLLTLFPCLPLLYTSCKP